MSGTIITILGLIIGAAIAVAGGVYLKKEFHDKESRKIYCIFVGIGLAVFIGVVIKIMVAGF